MRRSDTWRSSKFEHRGGRLRASLNGKEVALGSRLAADLVAQFYSTSLPEYACGDLVDLGCGKAPLFGVYDRRTRSVTLVDWGSSLHENPHLDLVQDLNSPLHLPSDSFDTVLLSDVLEHIREPAGLMQEIARILRPGGALLMNVPFLYGLHEVPHDYFRYTHFALSSLAESAGLEVKLLEPLGGWLDVMTDLSSKVLVAAHLGLLARLAQAACFRFDRTQLGRRLQARTAQVFPLGYCMVAVRPPLSMQVG